MEIRATSKLWPPDWEGRVFAKLRTLGYHLMWEFVEAHPTDGFLQLARRLAPPMLPLAMLTTMYYRDGHDMGDFRGAALRGLLRGLWDETPNGWKNYDERLTSGIYEIDLFVSWREELCAVDASVEPLAKAVGRALWHSSPPKGWSPAGPDDPILRAAFDLGWPAAPAPNPGTVG